MHVERKLGATHNETQLLHNALERRSEGRWVAHHHGVEGERVRCLAGVALADVAVQVVLRERSIPVGWGQWGQWGAIDGEEAPPWLR